jgi:hypothetical protein
MHRPPVRAALLAVGLFTFPSANAQQLTADKPAPVTEGRLVPGCQDRTVLTSSSRSVREKCHWLVRFERAGAQPRSSAQSTKSADEKAIEAALGTLQAAQPAQVDGDRASVLAQRSSGEFAVVSLTRRNQTWEIVAITEPSETYSNTGSGKMDQPKVPSLGSISNRIPL